MKKQILAGFTAAALLAGNGSVYVYAEGEQEFTVGICQFVEHQALDAATEGFMDALSEKMGDRVIFDEQNAQGDYSACTSIINGFLAKDVDLILANATASLQAAVTAETETPILGTSITEYGAALQLDDFDGTVGGNVSGTSDLAPLEEQAAMVKELFPDAGRVGLLYCSAEPNSEYQVEVVQKELEAAGYECGLYRFADSNDISAVTAKASEECDVIYVPTDNAVASNAELIANVCIPDKTPVIAGEESTCKLCGAATLSISYYDLGYTTGEMAVRILDEGEDISQMSVEYASAVTRKYNPSVCEELGIEIPEGYEALETE